MSKNRQLDTSTEALAKSEEYLANATDSFLWALNNLNASHDEKMSLDSLVKVIQHYTFRVALNKQSVQIAKTLQNVYLGCSDPTGSKEFWRYAGEQRLTEQTV